MGRKVEPVLSQSQERPHQVSTLEFILSGRKTQRNIYFWLSRPLYKGQGAEEFDIIIEQQENVASLEPRTVSD
jgi:hypothetical protein